MSEMQLSLQQMQTWLPGSRVVGDVGTRVARVHSDTRTLQAGDLFVALQGERFDANAFLGQAKQAGAVAALCNDEAALRAASLPGVVVADAKQSLGQLGRAWRAQYNLPLIAVTGSNGKTTVTQMIASILRAWQGDAALATAGNFNNDIGVPLTLLRLRTSHRVAVVELGMNHPGEIAQLATWAQATVALVNNAQREHQEFMATIEAVARENGAVIEGLSPQGAAVFPADDDYTALWQSLAGARRVLRFAIAADASTAEVTCPQPVWQGMGWPVQAHTPAGVVRYTLRVAGLHNVKNSLAATSCALAAGVPLDAIARGLETFEPVNGRSRALGLQLGARALTLVDDSYNANPDSVRAAIDVLAGLPGPRLLVLGDMGEVGNQGPQFHAEVGAYAKQRGIDRLYALGEQTAHSVAQFAGARHFENADALNAAVLEALPQLSSVLVKGSRFMRMERVVQAVTARADKNEDEHHAA